jgi:AcrR family transcriptional regulator
VPRGIGLDRERVVDAAAALVDTKGPEALTLAAVADGLGIRSPSLFKHVDSLDDLRVALAIRAYQGLDAALAEPGVDEPPLPSLRRIASAWRRFATEHPGVYALAARTSLDGRPEAVHVAGPLLERVLAAVARVTGPGDPAVHGARALRALVHGFVLLEQDRGFGLAVPVTASFDRAVDALLLGLGAPP